MQPLSNSPVLLLCSPGQALLPLFLVQKWLDLLGNAAPVAHFLHTSVHGGSGCFYSRLSPLLPQVPQGAWKNALVDTHSLTLLLEGVNDGLLDSSQLAHSGSVPPLSRAPSPTLLSFTTRKHTKKDDWWIIYRIHQLSLGHQHQHQSV
ncbi:hypothetical protein F2P79_002280 [Pimephales promelas]|nr:hypothetical protein F2P79_002280 [Pimephales promelas]